MDQTVIIVALIAAFPGIFATVAAIYARRTAAHARKAAEHTNDELIVVHGEIRALGKAVDGRLTELLKASKAAAFANGKAEGKVEGRDEMG